MQRTSRHLATFAGGCFWCTEAMFKRLKGVISVTPGYAGGSTDDPNYEDVSSGETGHAETIQIEFDSSIISYDQLLDVFFATHDPTWPVEAPHEPSSNRRIKASGKRMTGPTPNRQGADAGSQYRSAIFYHDEDQKRVADQRITHHGSSGNFQAPIVTQLLPFTNFFPAENYHKDYYEKHQDAPYCRVVIDPKIQKLYRDFKDLVSN